MNFLPAIPLSAVSAADAGFGGVAVNVDGTLFASVHRNQHCVNMYSIDGAGKRTVDVVVFSTTESPGSSHRQLNYPRYACFVHRKGCRNERCVYIYSEVDSAAELVYPWHCLRTV